MEVIGPSEQRESRDERIAGCGVHRSDLSDRDVARYPEHLRAAAPRKHVQRVGLAHEYMPLVYVDVTDGLDVDIDRLHQRARAHVVQKRVVLARADERRVRESVRVRQFAEGQLRPGPEMPAGCVSVVHHGGERGGAPLPLVRRRMDGCLSGGNVAGHAPDLLLSIEAVEDEVSIFILAMRRETDVVLETPIAVV
jgi:hypothetical protein